MKIQMTLVKSRFFSDGRIFLNYGKNSGEPNIEMVKKKKETL